MAEMTDDDDDEVRNRIRETFVKCISPDNIIWLFHKYDTKVLTENDIQQVKAKTLAHGPMEGAQLLLNRLPQYKNWFSCLLKVLQDEDVKLDHVAKTMKSKLNEIHLLLIGKCGSGKSATGNSIIGKRLFKEKSSSCRVTKNAQCEASDFTGRVIKIVDSPGVSDTWLGNGKSEDLFIEAMEYAIDCNPRGYHAFLLVVRFGGRFTKDDCDTIAFLKTIFGNDFVRNFCILVLSNGDVFEAEIEETGPTFKEWCDKQEGPLQELFKECNNRVILFDNKTRDEKKRYKQVSDLITMVDKMQTQGHPYTCTNFEQAKDAHRRLMIECQMPMIREETMAETSLILEKLNKIIKNYEHSEDMIEQLGSLHERTRNLLDDLQDKDQGTGVLSNLTSSVKTVIERRLNEEKERIMKQKE